MFVDVGPRDTPGLRASSPLPFPNREAQKLIDQLFYASRDTSLQNIFLEFKVLRMGTESWGHREQLGKTLRCY